MALLLADRVRCNTSTTGTGTVTLSIAPVGFITFAQAVSAGQLVSGCSVYYVIQEGTNWECGTGVYTSGAETMTRSVASSSSGTSAISLNGNAQVVLTLTTQFTTLALGATTAASPVLTGPVTLSSGNLLLTNGAKNTISFLSPLFGQPTTSTRSAGTRLVLWSDIATGGMTEYAVGMESSAMWFSVSLLTSRAFAYYANTTAVAALTSGGNLSTAGGLIGPIGVNTGAAGTFTTLQALTPTAGDSSTFVATTAFAAPMISNTGRNRLHNGRMQVIQRGTSFSNGVSGNTFTADRWRVGCSGISSSIAINATTSYGSAPNYQAITGTFTASGQNFFVYQRLEAADSMDLAGQTVTVSFYASASVTTGTFSTYFSVSYPPTTDNWGSATSSGTVNVTLTGSVQRVQGSLVVPVAATTGLSLVIVMQLATGTGGASTFNISNIQMEVGTKASIPEAHDLAHEYIICERYYKLIQASGRTYFGTAASFFHETYVGFRAMRATPTALFISSGSTLNMGSGSPTFTPSSNNSARFIINANASGDCYALGQTYSLSADI